MPIDPDKRALQFPSSVVLVAVEVLQFWKVSCLDMCLWSFQALLSVPAQQLSVLCADHGYRALAVQRGVRMPGHGVLPAASPGHPRLPQVLEVCRGEVMVLPMLQACGSVKVCSKSCHACHGPQAALPGS